MFFLRFCQKLSGNVLKLFGAHKIFLNNITSKLIFFISKPRAAKLASPELRIVRTWDALLYNNRDGLRVLVVSASQVNII